MSDPSAGPAHLAVHFVRFGPYHLARLSAAAERLASRGWRLTGLETAGLDQTYAWRLERGRTSFERCTVFPDASAEALQPGVLRRGVLAALDRLQPQAVAIAGWASPDARAALAWCRRHGARAILMSDTRAADGRRVWWKEAIKRRLLRHFDAALVAGSSHRDYLISLGFPSRRITTGFDVVDNAYFRSTTNLIREQQPACSPPFLLASNRFLPRKNLIRLLEAFAACRPAWNLCLLGDGPERSALEQQIDALGLWRYDGTPWDPHRPTHAGPGVFLPGFRQIEDLPQFYAQAAAFVHTALSEPWGLVINEAMAAGLPILSSANVGAAEELVLDGVNGYQFDPLSVDGMAGAISRFTALPAEQRAAMGAASACILEERRPLSAFADGLHRLLCLPPR